MNILICDDSSFARKAIARCIAKTNDQHVIFAEHGKHALEVMKETDIDVMFLDLTMPIMDGYEVLAEMPDIDYPTQVVVISGDVQQEAIDRCMSLGAFAFIKKPISPEELLEYEHDLGVVFTFSKSESVDVENNQVSSMKKLKELTNVALGRGASLLSEYLGEFITIPVPHAWAMGAGELDMTLQDVFSHQGSMAISQRFSGHGIHGEALVCMRGKDITTMGRNMGFTDEGISTNEIVLSVSSVVVSSYLQALGDQLGAMFTTRHPSIVDRIQREIDTSNARNIQDMFALEYSFLAETMDFECEVLLLLDSGSVNTIQSFLENV
ncbi:putative response regulator [Aliivibrio wodanis]|uniref:Putative response regulator n=1 Tax=Aliivibrio wodanis TaxID=80852 RepID=A0A090KIC9_9GAMM|nr:putative response regulator [Aliivibrio wodanis]